MGDFNYSDINWRLDITPADLNHPSTMFRGFMYSADADGRGRMRTDADGRGHFIFIFKKNIKKK